MPKPASFAFEVKLTFADVLRLQYFGIYRRIWPAILLLLMLFLIPMLSSLASVVTDGDSPSGAVTWMLGAAVFLLTVVGSPYLIARKSFKHQSGIQETMQYDVSTKGIGMTGDTSNSFVEWSNVREVTEISRHLVLYIGPYQGFLIPKRVFGDPGAYRDFKELVGECVPQKRFRRSGLLGRFF